MRTALCVGEGWGVCVLGERTGRGKSYRWATNFQHCDFISNRAIAMEKQGPRGDTI